MDDQKNILTTDPVVKFFISVIGVVFFVIILQELKHIFIPFTIAIFLFFVFEPLNKYLMSKKMPLIIAVFVDLIITIGIVWGLSNIIIVSFSQFGEALPLYEAKLRNMISSAIISIGLHNVDLSEISISSLLNQVNYGGIASGFLSSTLSIVSTTFFVLFFFLFIIGGQEHIIRAIKKRFIRSNMKRDIRNFENRETISDWKSHKDNFGQAKKDLEDDFENLYHSITSKIQRYLATKFFVSLATAILVGFILQLFNVDFVVVWAVLTFLFNFIPNIGSILSVVFPTLIAVVQFESVGYAVLIGGILGVIQNIIGNIIEPKIMGDRLGLNPLVILFSLLIWGYIWGIVGMFLSVPLTAVIKIIISNSQSPGMMFLSDLMDSHTSKAN